MTRNPNPHNTPFNIAENEENFMEQMLHEEESGAAALENYYAHEEWENGPEGPFSLEAIEKANEAMGIRKP